MLTFIVLSCLIVALNSYATVRVVRAGSYTRQQALLQALLIWVIPVVGAITVLFVLAADRVELHPQRDMDDAPRQGMAGIGPSDMDQGSGSDPGVH